MASQAASLLTVSGDDGGIRFFVHRWTATELAARAPEAGLAGAHRQAAAYWRWRVEFWPQDRAADVHDLLEARHHLLQAGNTEAAGMVTESAVSQLHTWGAWDQEAALIHDTLARLPADSSRRAGWIQQLGVLAHGRGDYEEAARQYQRSVDIKERLGDRVGLVSGYHQLGRLAQDRGDYEEAARQYHRSLDIKEWLGDQAGLASGYHQLGRLAQIRGDFDEAARQYHRSLDIEERLGNQAGMAISYYQFGFLETERGGSIATAIAWHVKALVIRLHLGVPQAQADLRRLSAFRSELGAGPFTSLLDEALGDAEAAETVTSWLNQWDGASDSPA